MFQSVLWFGISDGSKKKDIFLEGYSKLLIAFVILALFVSMGVMTVTFMVGTAKRMGRLQPFRAFAARPMRQLIWESSMFSGNPSVIFAQSRHRIQFSNLGSRDSGRSLMECVLPVSTFFPEQFYFSLCTHDFLVEDFWQPPKQKNLQIFEIEDETYFKRFGGLTTCPERAEAFFDARLKLALRQLDELFREKGCAFFISMNGS